MKEITTILLASRSPRREKLLREAGYDVRIIPSGMDDSLLRRGSVEPAQWVAALAFLKAYAGLRTLEEQNAAPAAASVADHTVLMGADTLVIADDRVIGQPRDAEHARLILQNLSGRSHEVISGVALVDPSDKTHRTFFHDRARVEVGDLSDEMIERYLESGEWKGKAGAYNLSERIAAGWPIRYEGDPATIMGLPMRILDKHLAGFIFSRQ